MEADSRGLAAQHPFPDSPVLRAALTGKTGLPGASSEAEGVWPAQGSSWVIVTTGIGQHSPGTAQAPVASREIIKDESFSPQYLPPAAHKFYMLHSLPCQQWDVSGNPEQQSQQSVTHHICWQQDNLGDLPADSTSSTQTLAPHTHAPGDILEVGSPTARQPPACNPQVAHLAAHSRSHIGQ